MQHTLEKQTRLCRICEKEISKSLPSHVIGKHKITCDEYFRIYGEEIRATVQDKLACQARKEIIAMKKNSKKLLNEKRDESWCDKIECKICGFEVSINLVTHIKYKHALSVKEYRILYPDAVVARVHPDSIEKSKTSLKQKYESDVEFSNKMKELRSSTIQIKHWTRKGLSENEARQKVSEVQSKYSKQITSEALTLKNEKQSGDSNPMSLASISTRYNVSREKAKQLTPRFGMTGSLHPMFGKNHSEETITKIAANAKVTFSNTSVGEKELGNFVIENFSDVKIERNIGICRYNCDIVIEELKYVIEYFGDNWHMNPKFYKENDIHFRTKETGKSRQTKDETKIKQLNLLGYDVKIVWASEWQKERETVIEEIKNAINTKKSERRNAQNLRSYDVFGTAA